LPSYNQGPSLSETRIAGCCVWGPRLAQSTYASTNRHASTATVDNQDSSRCRWLGETAARSCQSSFTPIGDFESYDKRPCTAGSSSDSRPLSQTNYLYRTSPIQPRGSQKFNIRGSDSEPLACWIISCPNFSRKIPAFLVEGHFSTFFPRSTLVNGPRFTAHTECWQLRSSIQRDLGCNTEGEDVPPSCFSQIELCCGCIIAAGRQPRPTERCRKLPKQAAAIKPGQLFQIFQSGPLLTRVHNERYIIHCDLLLANEKDFILNERTTKSD